MQQLNIFWFRRDLRFNDNKGLFHALSAGLPVLPVFIFDTDMLSKLEDRTDRRVEFIHAAIETMQDKLNSQGSTMEIFHGNPQDVFSQILNTYPVNKVFTNHDYDPTAIERDVRVANLLKNRGVAMQSYKDQVIMEKDEICKDDGKPYTVFTPYSRKWKVGLTAGHLEGFPSEKMLHVFFKQPPHPIPSLQELGFRSAGIPFPNMTIDEMVIEHYAADRDFPARSGTSKLGIHLRFGTLSIRELARRSKGLSETFLNELIWRDFYQMILWHFPQVGKGHAFKPAYDHIEWRRDGGEFDRWCMGQTGYPIVDAGMRQLNTTGFMHNRVRMIAASFLSKHLLLDWRLGEAWFARHLLDYDLAANNGGWQWAAGSGCDAAPYFRIFNPGLQTLKFDPKWEYISKWVPEFRESTYPQPIVEHEMARKRCLETYSRALKKQEGMD